MIRFGKHAVLMDEAADGMTGAAGGGGVADSGVTAGAAADAGQEFSISLDVTSTHETPEEKQARELGAQLEREGNGWVDPAKGIVTYERTGDPALDMALDFIGKAGYSHSHPAVQAALNGNFDLLSAELAAKGISGWEQHLALGKSAYEKHVKEQAAKTAEIKQLCIAAAGDEKTWTDTLAWASQNAEPHEKEQVNAALAQGGIVAEAMSAYLVHAYRNASGVTVTPQRSAVNPNAASARAGAQGAGPLSPSQYAAEVAKLRASGRPIEGTPEYAALQKRRAMYRG
ncbi:hypothetical protein [Burkholderia multivorans]|uniref:hypothetical protein n=1 Tax=Burkholderia multivorans TaxID=87883 RepID=UPI001C2741BC|nr:hypothetical protein [Burkholderia multivorans]MBU9528229.1 hypothetical protein [Burkholderia multivorans]